MKTASAYSILKDSGLAAQAAADLLVDRLGSTPDICFVYTTEHHARPEAMAVLSRALPGAAFIGGTTCGGVMTEDGVHMGPDGTLGLFGMKDDKGDFGVGACPIGADPVAAGAAAIQRALADAGRDFETPALVWCCQPPGAEESILAGIQSIVGSGTPVMGGSAADETIAGAWRQFAGGEVLTDHVVVAAMFPDGRIGRAFQSGYAPSAHGGLVTAAEGRTIISIDDRPAAKVYSEWTDGRIPAGPPRQILAESTAAPLGRVAGEAFGVPGFVLSHPSHIVEGGGLALFSDIAVGDRVVMMAGSPDSLVKRAGLVAGDAILGSGSNACAGGLIIYCGGCMLHVRDRLAEVVAEVRNALNGAPFLGAFTFGEQGEIVDAATRHGNLMVSALTVR
jgi:hypothetical protein